MSVVILAGGLSAERDVSLRSGRRMAESLREEGAEVTVLDLDAHLLPRLMSERPDVVIPLVHGAAGEDGSLADVMDALGLRYVGSGPVACRQSFDKAIAVKPLYGEATAARKTTQRIIAEQDSIAKGLKQPK